MADDTANDGFGLDKAARLRAEREREREEAVEVAKLSADFPYEVEPPDLDFLLG